MKQKVLLFIIVGALFFGGLVYGLLNYQKPSTQSTLNSGSDERIEMQQYSIELIDSLQNQTVNIYLAIDKREDDAVPDSEFKIIRNLDTGEELSRIRFDDFYGSSNFVNGFIAHITGYAGSSIFLTNALNGESTIIADVKLQENERIDNLTLSPSGNYLYIQLFQQYSTNDPIQAFHDYRTNSEVLRINLRNKRVDSLFSKQEYLETYDLLWGNDDYLIINKFGTEGGPRTYYIYNIVDRLFEPFVDQFSNFVISPLNTHVIIFPVVSYEEVKPQDFMLYNLEEQLFVEINGDESAILVSSEAEEWPDIRRFQNVVWSNDGRELVLSKLTFSNGDIDNANAQIITWNPFSGEVKELASFRTEDFSIWGVLGKVNEKVYAVGQHKKKDQIRVFPGGEVRENNFSQIIYK